MHHGRLDAEPRRISFDDRKTKPSDANSPPVDFDYHEWLATRIEAGSYPGGYRAIVVLQPEGSCYRMHESWDPMRRG